MNRIRTTAFHKAWLIVTAIVIGSFGPVFSLATRQATSGPARWALDFLNGPGGDRESYADGTLQFLSALTGGFLFGWGVTVLCLRFWAFDLAPNGVRKCVVTGLVSWFVLDSTGSLASGNAWNAFYNVVVLLCAVGPLWLPANDVSRQ
jgi:hypothetical protein